MGLLRKSKEDLENTMDQVVELLYSKMEERIRKDILYDDNSIGEILSRARNILSERIETAYKLQREKIEEAFRQNASPYTDSVAFERAKKYRRASMGEIYALYEKRKQLLEELGL